MCYLDTNDKITCSGCEACANICPHKAICMIPDSEEFRYPKINIDYARIADYAVKFVLIIYLLKNVPE